MFLDSGTKTLSRVWAPLLAGASASVLTGFLLWHPHGWLGLGGALAVGLGFCGLVACLLQLPAARHAEQMHLMEQRHREEMRRDRSRRYVEAVNLLGHESMPVRTGALYALEQLEAESPEDHRAITDTLCSFVRNRVHRTDGDLASAAKYRTEVQAAIRILGRRQWAEQETTRLEITGVDIPAIQLKNARLTGVRLEESNLSSADLTGASLDGAGLMESNLAGAFLVETDLSGACLLKADLTRAVLVQSKLVGAELDEANLAGADLSSADLSRARLRGADFNGAYLAAARLDRADLRNAQLTSCDLTGTSFRHADLRGADFTGSNLDRADTEGARTDDTTVLPK